MKANLVISPDSVDARIDLPSSKSISNRVQIIHALAGGKEKIFRLSDCDDTRVMREALQTMPHTIDIGAAGTAMRFLTAYLATQEGTHILTGSDRMKQRPIKVLVDALLSLGAMIEYIGEEGFPPLRITGTRLRGGEVILNGNVSSQFISALLLIAPTLKEGLRLRLMGHIVSRPYIDMTLKIMHDFGAEAHWEGDDSLVVLPGSYRDMIYKIESDWSAASYWYEIVAACPEAHVRLMDLLLDSTQGDSRIADMFEQFGVHTEYEAKGIRLTKTDKKTDRFEGDFEDMPDMAQTVAVTCTLIGIPFRMTGLQTLRIKETDRIKALYVELFKLGYEIKIGDDGNSISWDGFKGNADNLPILDTYEDHRMAMALAPTSFVCGELEITNPDVVRKSYTGYWKDLKKAGFKVQKLTV